MEPFGSSRRRITPYRGDSDVSGFIPEGRIFSAKVGKKDTPPGNWLGLFGKAR